MKTALAVAIAAMSTHALAMSDTGDAFGDAGDSAIGPMPTGHITLGISGDVPRMAEYEYRYPVQEWTAWANGPKFSTSGQACMLMAEHAYGDGNVRATSHCGNGHGSCSLDDQDERLRIARDFGDGMPCYALVGNDWQHVPGFTYIYYKQDSECTQVATDASLPATVNLDPGDRAFLFLDFGNIESGFANEDPDGLVRPDMYNDSLHEMSGAEHGNGVFATELLRREDIASTMWNPEKFAGRVDYKIVTYSPGIRPDSWDEKATTTGCAVFSDAFDYNGCVVAKPEQHFGMTQVTNPFQADQYAKLYAGPNTSYYYNPNEYWACNGNAHSHFEVRTIGYDYGALINVLHVPE